MEKTPETSDMVSPDDVSKSQTPIEKEIPQPVEKVEVSPVSATEEESGADNVEPGKKVETNGEERVELAKTLGLAQKKIAEAQKRLMQAEKKSEQDKNIKETLRTEKGGLKLEVSGLERENSHLMEQLNEANATIDGLKAQIEQGNANITEKINEAATKIGELMTQIENLNTGNSELKKQAEDMAKQVGEGGKIAADIRVELRGLSRDLLELGKRKKLPKGVTLTDAKNKRRAAAQKWLEDKKSR